jgi:hypothetical protein
MADEGFKRWLTVILYTDYKNYSRLVTGPEELMLYKLAPFFTSKTDIGRQYWLFELYWTNGCDDRQYLTPNFNP